MSRSEQQQVTVIVATRNRVQQLERMLSSLEHQILPDVSFDVIVVDNGSTDDTPSLLQREWTGLKIRALHEPVAGKSRALNRALNVASGTLRFSSLLSAA